MSVPVPNCYERSCRHFQGTLTVDLERELSVPICTAFPEGIPHSIAYGDDLHLKPVEGDNGILFEEGEME